MISVHTSAQTTAVIKLRAAAEFRNENCSVEKASINVQTAIDAITPNGS